MKLYNTLTKHVDELELPDNVPVTFYSCGPTVYDVPHIGNWYTFIRYDLLVRMLKASGYKVNWVMNITDVGHLVSDEDEGQDKLEKGAAREGKTAEEVAAKYTQYFVKGLKRLNFTVPAKLPKATEHIQEQIDMIKELEAKGHTYTIAAGVYFDTSTFPDYGKMAGLDLDKQKAGARIDADPQKRNPSDFALWKFSPKDEIRHMEWDSPWGTGFPGWHIECSAMSMKHLGSTLDIHGGGIDHIPIHHTNEIAQSEAVTGRPFSKSWFHCNFCLVDGKKISKSAGSFITLEDIEAKGFDLMAFRLLVLQSHYRTEAHFTWDNLQAAQRLLNKWRATFELYHQAVDGQSNSLESVFIDTETSLYAYEDLSTPNLVSHINSIMDTVNKHSLSKDEAAGFFDFISRVEALTGLRLKSDDINADLKQLLAKRQIARQEKNFDELDKLRGELEAKGLSVRDTPRGQVWSRI